MKKIFLAFLFLFSACAPRQKVVDIQIDFQPIVTTFLVEGNNRGHHIVIDDLIVHFGTPTQNEPPLVVIGQCQKGDDMTPTVVIDKGFWDANDSPYRELLLFHELGHCVLNLGHTDGIMLSSLMPELEYKNNRNIYLNQFFEKTQ